MYFSSAENNPSKTEVVSVEKNAVGGVRKMDDHELHGGGTSDRGSSAAPATPGWTSQTASTPSDSSNRANVRKEESRSENRSGSDRVGDILSIVSCLFLSWLLAT
jgi:hypothetical protein